MSFNWKSILVIVQLNREADRKSASEKVVRRKVVGSIDDIPHLIKAKNLVKRGKSIDTVSQMCNLKKHVE